MKYLGRGIVAVVSVAGIGLLLSGSAPVAGASGTSSTRYVTLSADGTVKVVPDAVLVNATVSVVGTSNADALSSANTTSAAVRTAIKANGVATKDIATQNISVYPEYDYSNNTSKLIGYRANQGFAITVRDTSNAGAVVAAIVNAGGNNLTLGSVSPFVTNSDKGLEAARALAVKNATVKAKSYEALLGVKLGQVNYLVENSGSTPTLYPPMYATASKDASVPTTIDLGQQDVTVNVTIQWSLL